MNALLWVLAVILWIAMSAQGLQAQQAACPSDVEARLNQLGISLPPPAQPAGSYVEAVRTGNVIFLAGVASKNPDGTLIKGKVGTDLNVDQGYQAARQAGLILLSNLKAALGDLNKVTRIVKVLGLVNADPTFTQHPAVINGMSDLMGDVFGDCGKHARSAAGMSSLPSGVAVEVEMVVEVAPQTPTAAIALPKNVTVTSTEIQLDGSQSTSADSKPLTYLWTIPQGSPSAAILKGTTATPSVQFAQGSALYTFQLTVTDSVGKSSTDLVTVNYIGH